jgi:hypothetical protein
MPSILENHTALDLVWGADAIASEIGVNVRRCFYLLENGELPAQKVGGRWVADRGQLRERFIRGVQDR